MHFIKSNPTFRKREYHVYKMASNGLKLLHSDLIERQNQLKVHATNPGASNLNFKKLLRTTKHSNAVKDLLELEVKLDACANMITLCDQAYELGKNIRQGTNLKQTISEELFDFISITNENHTCYIREDYEKIKLLHKTK